MISSYYNVDQIITKLLFQRTRLIEWQTKIMRLEIIIKLEKGNFVIPSIGFHFYLDLVEVNELP